MMECKFCGGTSVIGIEYQGTSEDYDGISEWQCGTCARRWGRWTGKELQDGELEPRYGRDRSKRTDA